MIPNVRFILLRPRGAANLGAAARALKNFGLADWTLVAPEAELGEEARRMAVQSEELLESVQRAPSLEAAAEDAVWVVATSSRNLPGKRRLTPEAFAKEALARAAQGKVALVFGDERSGLRNEEIVRCHDLSSIPTEPAQPSVNLAQAVLVYAYELGKAARALEPTSEDALPTAATDGELDTVRTALGQALRERGFLQTDERHAVDDLLGPLIRSRLSRQEATLWRAALHALRKGRSS